MLEHLTHLVALLVAWWPLLLAVYTAAGVVAVWDARRPDV